MLKFVERTHTEYTLEIMGSGKDEVFACDEHWNPVFSCPEEEALFDELMLQPHKTKTSTRVICLPPIGICDCGHEDYADMWVYGRCRGCGKRYTISGEEVL